MKCPSCTFKLRTIKAKRQRKGTMGVEFQCPECDVWLRQEPKMEKVKNIGYFIWLPSTLGNLFIEDEPLRMGWTAMALVGCILTLIGVFKGRWLLVE